MSQPDLESRAWNMLKARQAFRDEEYKLGRAMADCPNCTADPDDEEYPPAMLSMCAMHQLLDSRLAQQAKVIEDATQKLLREKAP